MLQEIGPSREILVFSVLKHEQSAGLQQAALHHAIGQFGQFAQGIGGIGKNEVESFGTLGDEAQCIGVEHAKMRLIVAGSAVFHRRSHEGKVLAVALYTHHFRTSTAQQFEGDAPCPRK